MIILWKESARLSISLTILTFLVNHYRWHFLLLILYYYSSFDKVHFHIPLSSLRSMASTAESLRPPLGGGVLSCYPILFLPLPLLVAPFSRRRQANMYFLLLSIPEDLHKETNSRFKGGSVAGKEGNDFSIQWVVNQDSTQFVLLSVSQNPAIGCI